MITHAEWLGILEREEDPMEDRNSPGQVYNDRKILIAAVRELVRDLKAGYEADSWRRAMVHVGTFDSATGER